MTASQPLLSVEGLRVNLPDGGTLLAGADLAVEPGRVVVLLGGSGAGKTTLGRVLFDLDGLREQGFEVSWDKLERDGELGFVPQRGAAFDHLDVSGNIRIALRYASPPREQTDEAVSGWLEAVDLPRGMARPGTPVSSLSGGQAQRLAVARTLAGGREVLFLDEPSTGLDPYRVRLLAELVLEQARGRGSAVVVVTHDVTLAALVADELFILDTTIRRLEPVFPESWPGPTAADEPAFLEWAPRLDAAVTGVLAAGAAEAPSSSGARAAWPSRLASLLAPLRVAVTALTSLVPQLAGRPGDFLHILSLTARSALLRPLAFFSVVSTLLGFTVLYVLIRAAPGGVRADEIVRMIGGAYIVALAPPLTAFLFAAGSGGALNAWLGGMGLTRQVQAMKALGIDDRRYLWTPVWFGLGVSFLGAVTVFAAGLFLGGYLLCLLYGIAAPAGLLAGDLLDPVPDRVPNLVRALWLAFIYAWGIASDVVAKGAERKSSADDVTSGMIRQVVSCTLWVVALELATAVVLFAWKDGAPI